MKTAKPGCLSISTPSDESVRSPAQKRPRTEAGRSISSRRTGDTVVEIHQKDDIRPTTKSERSEETDSILRQIFAQGISSKEALRRKINSLPEASLHKLSQQQSRLTHDYSDTIHETIITRGMSSYESRWSARMVTQGIRADRGFWELPSNYRLFVNQLDLLACIGERFCEPEVPELIEERCLEIIAAQSGISSHLEPLHWIMAYLFRIHGCRGLILKQSTVSKMQEMINDQLYPSVPKRSLVWATQQYARWCARNEQYDVACDMLERVSNLIPEMDYTERISKDENEKYWRLCQRSQSLPDVPSMSPKLHELYPVDSDAQLFEAVRTYLRQRPRTMADDQRTKDLDGGHWPQSSWSSSVFHSATYRSNLC